MLFNSLDYLLFLPLVVLIFFGTPPRYRHLVLLVASYCFYGWWNPSYVVLLAFSTIVDYLAALRMGALSTRRARRPYLVASLTINLSLLFLFKYFYFFVDTVEPTLRWFGVTTAPPAFSLLLPIGISFYTFQTIGYSIDVYRGKLKPERSLALFALYVSFFPQLVAGPIERARNLLPQLRRHVSFDLDAAAEGLTRITWGFFKKLFIADRLAIYVDYVYGSPATQSTTTVTIATILFYFQLYCDFSGYTDIAIGTARIFGIRLMENFRRPYLARSIAEGWARWHISLSTWFRDYLYIPLARELNKSTSSPEFARSLAIGIVFVLIGVWHGAEMTFVIFGLLHAIYMISGRVTSQIRDRIWITIAPFQSRDGMVRHVVQVTSTFTLAAFAMLFFRVTDMSDAILLLESLLRWSSPSSAQFIVPFKGRYELTLALFGLALLMIVEYVESRSSLWETIRHWPTWLRWSSAYVFMLLIIMFGVTSREKFIYFHF